MMKCSRIAQLEKQGCFSDDWSLVSISSQTDLRLIRNVVFRGNVSVGANAQIFDVPGGICNVRIGDNVRIVNVGKISRSPGACFGIGTDVDVLDESGLCHVRIFPGMSAQLAAACARMPDVAGASLFPLIDAHIRNLPDMPEIGDDVEISGCGDIADVRIWNGVKIEGASRLKNGCLVNNSLSSPLCFVGNDVDAENFIVEDGMLKGGARIRNTYVGQGTLLDNGFFSHDSLFFANCSMENGEACALFAGPFSVSMHKNSLLIGCQTSFMNAGSATNMSNHMYKLGPVHWGVLERGVKSASGAYVMHGSRIGAFSLLMGAHKKHPDTSMFPFSYLFGDADGATTVVPGAMLRSYGLKRDAEKWQRRDRREGHGLSFIDRVCYPPLNPSTVGDLLRGLEVIGRLEKEAGPDFLFNGLRFSKKSLQKGASLYDMAVSKFVCDAFSGVSGDFGAADESASGEWIDLGGQVIPVSVLDEALACCSVSDFEAVLTKAFLDFESLQRSWIAANLGHWLSDMPATRAKAQALSELIESDRLLCTATLSAEREMLRLRR